MGARHAVGNVVPGVDEFKSEVKREVTPSTKCLCPPREVACGYSITWVPGMLGRTSYVHKQLMIVIAPKSDDSASLKGGRTPPIFFF